ncbi:MAG: RIP metalloprotease RseP [Patescibacteria group bacterium]|nr:RIP metalloprotease RseP [Patescibacteria group bacterium]MDD4611066.1 RIP metalloprotease RseP [Patescibacteria group bacterium]
MLLTIIIFFLVLSVLVFAHELGHFFVARIFGVRAEEFGFGFPPRIGGFQTWREKKVENVITTEELEIKTEETQTAEGKVARQTIFDRIKNIGVIIVERKWKFFWSNKEISAEEQKHGTVYSANWIPMGGFVKIKGENGEGDHDQDSMINKPVWQRSLILSAGVIMNVLLAVFLISVGLMFGMPRALDGVTDKAVVTNQKIQVAELIKDSPAEKSGLKVGDIILAIDNKNFTKESDLQNFVNENSNKELTYKIKRGSEEKELKIKPELKLEDGRMGVGIAIAATGIVKYPWHLAIWEGTKTTVFLLWAIIVAFYNLIKDIILGHGVSANLSGPVGIATITGEAARMGWVYLLQITALLSVNLAVINFLPFPALDGGRVFFLIIEKFKGKPVRREVEAVIHNIGFILLMVLVLVVTLRDVLKIWHQ